MSSKVDGKADQYSLAVMAYELLSGRKPFEAEAPHTLTLRIMNEEPEPIHKLNPGLARECSTVFEKALAKKAVALPIRRQHDRIRHPLRQSVKLRKEGTIGVHSQ